MSVLDVLAAEINKKFGMEVLLRGSAARQEIPRTTTGILAYDLALGGGWAANQWNEIVGEESSGKTALCYRTVAANQALDPDWTCMWIAAEEYVPSYAASFGVDLDRLWVLETNEMEPALELALKAIEQRAVDCLVIDSLPALVTETEVSKKMDEASIATGAKILSNFFKKCAKAQRRSLTEDERTCTMIAINQWRDQIGVSYGDPRTTPGGKAKNYYFFTRMDVRRDEWLTSGSKIEDRIGQSIKCRIMKNKTYRPQQVASVDVYFADGNGFHAGDFDLVKDVVYVCLAVGVIDRKGAWYSYGGYKWNGKAPIFDDVRSDIDLQDELRSAALDAVLGGGAPPSGLEIGVEDEDTLDSAPIAEVV